MLKSVYSPLSEISITFLLVGWALHIMVTPQDTVYISHWCTKPGTERRNGLVFKQCPISYSTLQLSCLHCIRGLGDSLEESRDQGGRCPSSTAMLCLKALIRKQAGINEPGRSDGEEETVITFPGRWCPFGVCSRRGVLSHISAGWKVMGCFSWSWPFPLRNESQILCSSPDTIFWGLSSQVIGRLWPDPF